MRVGMRVALGLAAFLLIAGLVLLFTSYEWRGSVELLVTAVAFGYIGLVLRGAFRRASVSATPETPVAEELPTAEPHVGPTIWPFVFSIAAVLLVVGIVGIHWILIPGGILFVGAAGGWFLDIKHQWHPGGLEPAHEHAAASPSTLQRDQQPNDDDRE